MDITPEQHKLAAKVKDDLENFITWWNAADAAGLQVNFQITPSPAVGGPFRVLAKYSIQTKPLDVLVGPVAQDNAPVGA
jgi:hypothetical protein